MAFLRDLSVSRKFTLGFGLACLLCALQGGISIFGFVKDNASIADLTDNSLPSVVLVGNLRSDMAAVRRAELAFADCGDNPCRSRFKQRRSDSLDRYRSDLDKYGPLVSYPGERELYDTFRQTFEKYLGSSTQAMAGAESGKFDEAKQTITSQELTGVFDSALAAVASDADLNASMGSQTGKLAIQAGHRYLVQICAFVGVTVLLCAAIGYLLTKLIAPPLQAATDALERVADKDLTVNVEARGADEIGRLCAALNTSVNSMRSVLTAVAEGAENLSASSTEMSVRSVQSKGNAQSQSGKTNQIAAAAQEMTATIGEIGRNASSASDASRKSAEMANQGGAVMQSAAGTMERISAAASSVADKMTELSRSSEEIGKVVTVIQDISEQTNLLALNAAIEAARAGEHGRGFAVVAGEVRRLAERTRSATGEIAGTIRSIQDETRQTLELMSESHKAVDSGIGETSRARQSLEAIIGSSREVEHMIQMIATAATEQTAAAGEISESATHISQLATENSQVAEETADGCKQLSVLANDLDGIIRQFRLRNDSHSGSPRPRGTLSAAPSLRTA